MHDDRVAAAVAEINPDNIRSTIEMLSALNTRYHSSTTGTGSAVAGMLAERYEALAMGRPDVTVSTYDHGSETPQRSLVVRIEGRTHPDEVIVLGSHLDSINQSSPRTGRAPGSDDNASGTATNLEVFRAIMQQGLALDRTLEIHAYAAEEIGLVGSADIAAHYRDAGVNVLAMMQHDMDLWKAPNTPDKIWFVTTNTTSQFNALLGTLVDGYVGMAHGTGRLSSGSSDHQSWYDEGFPAAFPFENPSSYNRNIHTANDTIANSGAFTQAAGFAKLGVAYVLHFGGIN
jgi:leucyl aminopeptidase